MEQFSFTKKQENNSTRVPALPFTFDFSSVLSSFTGCRKHFSKHVEVMLSCFKLKLWETKWLYVLVMKIEF